MATQYRHFLRLLYREVPEGPARNKLVHNARQLILIHGSRSPSPSERPHFEQGMQAAIEALQLASKSDKSIAAIFRKV